MYLEENYSVEDVVSGVGEIASPPLVYSRINEAINTPECSASAIAKIISEDPSLTSKLLKLANSAFIGLAKSVDSVSRAVSVLGTTQIRDLALATSVVSMFSGIPKDLVDMNSFWKHSIGCAILSKLLAMNCKAREVERFFVAGILHDFGRLILFIHAPEAMKECLERSLDEDISLTTAEREAFGFDHASVGALILTKWNLPTALVEAVAFHHKPHRATTFRKETDIIHVADLLIHAFEIGQNGETAVPVLSKRSWENIDMNPDKVESLIRRVEDDVEQISTLMLSN